MISLNLFDIARKWKPGGGTPYPDANTPVDTNIMVVQTPDAEDVEDFDGSLIEWD